MPTTMSTTGTSCFLEEANDDATGSSSSSCSTMTTTATNSSSSSSLMLLKLNQAQAQIIRHHKRPSSPFDCQSLQSSLKRVRLSCSPGELRLQRDLQSLPRAYGWQQIAEDRWSKLGDEYPNPQAVGVELHLLDPLRLVLYLKRDQHPSTTTTTTNHTTNTTTARLWIQIPRMYPHRPPAVSRIENLWMERIVVHEAPPMQPPEEPPYSDNDDDDDATTSFGTTVVYNQWSPVLHLGDLLDFLLETTCERQPTGPGNHNNNNNTRRTQQTTMNHNHVTMNHMMNPPNFCTSPTHANVGFFMEEHKMEDVANASSSNYNKYRSFLSPNRFDVGYGKYMDPLAAGTTGTGSAEESQPQHHSMDVN